MISLKFHHKSVFGYIQGDSDWALKSPEQARQGWPSLWRGTVTRGFCTIDKNVVIAMGQISRRRTNTRIRDTGYLYTSKSETFFLPIYVFLFI